MIVRRTRSVPTLLAVVHIALVATHIHAEPPRERLVLETASIPGGLIVHLGCGDGARTAGLRASDSFLVHGLDVDPGAITQARRRLRSLGVYGPVSVDTFDGTHLPYANELVNAIVVSDGYQVATDELRRVLVPGGVIVDTRPTPPTAQRKPWPDDIDDWSHYLHGADNNAVAQDDRIGPPRSLQWIGTPRWARHHDKMASMSALVTSGGRLFYIFDEGSTASILLPSKWSLIARDAFNGVVLWKQPLDEWHTRMWPLKSGPAQLPRRLVATEDTVFATLGIDVPVTALDARTGEVLRTYEGTKATEEVLHSEGVLFLVVNPSPNLDKYRNAGNVRKPWWEGETVKVMAVEAAAGKKLWEYDSPVMPLTLGVDDRRVAFHDGEKIVCLDRATGTKRWESVPVPVPKRLMSFFAPTLVLQQGVVLFAGGEESGLVKSGGGATKNDTLTALDGDTGKVLWTGEHPPSGYSSPEDVFVLGDTVWCEGVSNGNLPGVVLGYDLRTGEVKKRHEAADVETYWFHHRCYRNKATKNYLMTARTGIEFIDPETGHWDLNHWSRGGCLYGLMPANGLVYTPPHDCACYPESKLFGFSALSAGTGDRGRVTTGGRLERGPAYGALADSQSTIANPQSTDWPTYRGNAARSGSTSASVLPDRTDQTDPSDLSEKWTAQLGGKLSAVTIAEGKLFVAQVDQHTVHALDASNGKPLWSFTAGGRVDSPPTIDEGAALFGCADGWIYCLRASDGVLAWRFRAAPADSRIMAFEQLESRWPVSGAVLVQDGVVHAVAGRSLFLDGGMRLVRLDAKTGKLLSEELLDEKDPETGQNIQVRLSRLTMPVALPDVLSFDGKYLYMRSQAMDLKGKRLLEPIEANKVGQFATQQDGETRHLFSSNGFLDGDWFHRSYWMYGKNFEGGWNGYYQSGKRVPAGKIMVCDDTTVYGYGRQVKYFKWTTPMEFHLFAAPRDSNASPPRKAPADEGSIVRVEKSKSLDPSNTALTVSAWVRSDGPDGVVFAQGGGIQGYSLYLKNGKAHFAVCANSKRSVATSKVKLPGGWVHLAGVLTADAQLRVYVNGEEAGSGKAPGLIPKDPADAIQVGADEGSAVGDYQGPSAFKGDLDEIRVYHSELNGERIRRRAEGGALLDSSTAKLVLHFPFDDGKASDVSGSKNRSAAIGLKPVPGKIVQALRFVGRVPGQQTVGTRVHNWSVEIPVLVRGMVAAGKTLIVTGPEDVLDEPAALKAFDEPDTQQKLVDQEAALEGKSGGVLRAVACADGTTLLDQRLDTIPVWDGLAVANGALFMAGVDGTVRCYASN